MHEAAFIKANHSKWIDYEYKLSLNKSMPVGELFDAYTDLTGDLAYAQTHYPTSTVVGYLNEMLLSFHKLLSQKRHSSWRRLATFFTHEMPLTLYACRRQLLLSLVILLVAVAMGVVMSLAEFDNIRTIMGDAYVDMTISNIENGDPAAVYRSGSGTDSFLLIVLNNLWCDVMALAFGLLTSLGPAFYLLNNGINLGCFFTIFHHYDVLGQASIAIMMHGTFEITTMVTSGAAGLVLGSGLLFPGTYSRTAAFRRSARLGLKLFLGTVPYTIIAAFIEGYITRYTHADNGLRLAAIAVMLVIAVFYFIILPVIRHRQCEK